MARRIGENIQREWDEDPLAPEVWDACQLLKQNRDAGLAAFTCLGDRGSALAMMYLGNAYVLEDDPDRVKLGEEWLIRSAEAGSIEGRFQLALHYRDLEIWEKAVPEFKALAAQGYAPGMYFLGCAFYSGKCCDRSIPDAIHFLKMASDAGHLPALGVLSRIYFKEKNGLFARLRSHWYCLKKVPGLIWYICRYRNSDRLRGMPTFPHVQQTT